MAFGTDYNVDYKFMVEPGRDNTAHWVNIAQLKGNPDPNDSQTLGPVLAVQLDGERLRVVARSDGSASTTTRPADKILYTSSADIERGHWYQVHMDLKLAPTGGGYLTVKIDGETVASYNGAIGYNDVYGPYWKIGVYRDDAPETLAVQYQDFHVNGGGLPSSTASSSSFISWSTDSLPTIDPAAALKSLTTTLSASADLLRLDGSSQKVSASYGADQVNGGGGNDTLNGGTGADTLQGESGNDYLYGGSNNDSLHAGSGDDVLVGGLSSDTLMGGTGADKFVFTSPSDGADRIWDFNSQEDTLLLSKAGFGVSDVTKVALVAGLGSTTAGRPAIHFVQDTGQVYWDPTGGDAGDAKLIAVVGHDSALFHDSIGWY